MQEVQICVEVVDPCDPPKSVTASVVED